MLYFEWKEEDALKYAKEEGYENGFEAGEKLGEQRGIAYGEQKERENNIRALRDVLPAETIAEKFNLSKEYVIDVLKHDMCVCEPQSEYKVLK